MSLVEGCRRNREVPNQERKSHLPRALGLAPLLCHLGAILNLISSSFQHILSINKGAYLVKFRLEISNRETLLNLRENL